MKYGRLVKRIAATFLCAAMGMSSGVMLQPTMEAQAAGYSKVDGNYQMLDGTVINDVVARGIDVSRWQGNIDWNAVAHDDVSFVMLGTRSRGIIDPFFHANMKGASAAGLKVGAYIYSLATTPEMAVAEADFVLDLVKEYPISFPIAFDAEDSTIGALPPTQVSEIINAFCKRIQEAGYYPIVYANDYWLANKIDMSMIHHDVWVARYEMKHNFSNPIMWQATSTGSIGGIQGNVDIDFLYKDLTPNLPANLWRTIGKNTYYYQDYAMQKDAWIQDGTGWFYMNGDGLVSKGWMEKAGLRYYLDDSTGKMATGWKQFDGKWYFLQDNGAMASGWIDHNGSRYCLNSDGVMMTGWQTNGKTKYFLADSGAAVRGWQMLDGNWYYFNPDGDMALGWANQGEAWYYLNADGKMTNGWLTDGGATYYLSTSSGKMTVGWREIDRFWHYFNGNGAMATGLTDVNGQLYYLNSSDGKMAVSTTIDFDGVEYTVDGNGICTKIVAETAAAETAAETTGGLENATEVEVGQKGPGM